MAVWHAIFVNVGWVFIVANYPKYLEQRFQVAPEDRSTMQTVTLLMGCVGMAIGGFFADFMYRQLGPRWGRSIPVGMVLFTCAMTYILATQLPTAWGVAIALGMMAFCVDLAIPTMWAFAQDVGGRYSGASLGWGNMIGNFGAAISPVTLRFIRKQVIAERTIRSFSWNVAFFVCSAAFVLAGVCALSLNALIPVVQKKVDQAEDFATDDFRYSTLRLSWYYPVISNAFVETVSYSRIPLLVLAAAVIYGAFGIRLIGETRSRIWTLLSQGTAPGCTRLQTLGPRGR